MDEFDDCQTDYHKKAFTEMSVIKHYQTWPEKCQAECLGNCIGEIIKREFLCKYRPNPGMKYGGDFTELINFCDGHYTTIMANNNNISPELYYEWCLGEVVYILINKYL